MADETEAQLDVLDVLDDEIEMLLASLDQKQDPSAYTQGQIAYLEALQDRLTDVPLGALPRDLLEETAHELGLTFQDGAPEDPIRDDQDAGILAAWALCLGFVEGAARGAQAAADALDAYNAGRDERGIPR